MKIAILTVPFNNNYGGFLQAFALKTVLQARGHSVEFLMRKRCRPNRIERIRNLFKWLARKTTHCYYLEQYHISRISKNTSFFVKEYLSPISKYYYTSESFNRFLKRHQADVYIAGSDQCWRYRFAPRYIDDYFFKQLLGSKRKRISYAASFGVDFLEYDERMRSSCETCLKEFSAISVREDSGVRLLEDYFHIPRGKAIQVLDPTLLLSVDHYLKIINKYPIEDNNYLFVYILDDSYAKENVAKYIQNYLKLKRNDQKAQTGDVRKLKTIEPVELWLSRIYHSSFVFTDSYHGMLFSILFNKPFIVFGNDARGKARFDSVLRMLHLNQRYIIDSMGDLNSLLKDSLDWNYVNSIIEQQRKISLDFLYNSIEIS